jgi:hypothetical protein
VTARAGGGLGDTRKGDRRQYGLNVIGR